MQGPGIAIGFCLQQVRPKQDMTLGVFSLEATFISQAGPQYKFLMCTQCCITET